jgi:hypothetical protein
MARTEIPKEAKRYYKVLLEGIDRDRETVESFALKLSMRLRTPITRVRHIMGRLPATLKEGLTVAQANRLAAVLEELGGVVRVEAYYEIPGQRSGRSTGLRPKGEVPAGRRRRCPQCGWEEAPEAEFCSLCLAPFEPKREEKLVARIPEENPLELDAPGPRESRRFALAPWMWIAAALLLLLLWRWLR